MGQATTDLLRDLKARPQQVKTTIQALAFAAGAIGFCHQFLFPAKSEVEEIRRELIRLDNKIAQVAIDAKHARELDQKTLESLDANLRRFMTRKGVAPITGGEEE